ncbi:MAG: hypothetical protein AMXMBFR56_26900 [Polyangiaceae bacterium]
MGACGGEVGADHGAGGSAGAAGGGGSAAVAGDGSTGDIDATPDSEDAPDGGADADGPVQTCAACGVTEYSCTQQGMESFDWVVSGAGVGGCAVTDPWQNAPKELHCEPLEVCNSPPTWCRPISMGDGGVLTWTWDQFPSSVKVTCYPKT